MSSTAILVANFAATCFMVGLIWIIQIVHYPMFNRVGPDQVVSYAQIHTRLITGVVGPPMLIEMGTSVWLALSGSVPRFPAALWWIGLAALVLIWLSTWFLQVPCHEKLCQAFDPEIHRQLVRTNWIRTILWSFRGGLVCYALYCLLQTTPKA